MHCVCLYVYYGQITLDSLFHFANPHTIGMAYIENMRNAHNTCQFMFQSTIQIEQTTQILQPQSEEIQVLKRTHIFVYVVFSCGGFSLIWLADYLILSNICSIFIVTVVFISHANRNSVLRKTLVLSTEPSSNDLLVLLVPSLSHSVIQSFSHSLHVSFLHNDWQWHFSMLLNLAYFRARIYKHTHTQAHKSSMANEIRITSFNEIAGIWLSRRLRKNTEVRA